jgi:2-haloacid dehalogenase
MSLESVRALTFDVFGTVVDWRSSVIRQCEAFGKKHSIETDWAAFTDDWRYDGYMGGIRRVITGELPFQTAGALHRRKLDQLLVSLGVSGLPEDEIAGLNRAWHRLDPWPDSVAGLARLRTKYIVSTLSNGNFRLLVDMARHGGLQWDCILSADVTGAFKPQPECYLAAARILDLEPNQVMMVAAHKGDLQAAQKAGLQAADPAFQLVATDFHDLATKLGC